MTAMNEGGDGELRRGWAVILAAMAGVGFGAMGLPFYTMGLFVKPLTTEFGWSRGEVSAANLCLQGGLIVAAPLAGLLTDRAGVRKVGITSMIALALALAALTAITSNVLTLYAGWIVLALVGGGTTPTVWTRAVNSWFSRRRGLALGLSLAGTGLAAVAGPILIGQLIADHGWRAGYLGMAAATLLLPLPIVFLFLREKPAAEAADGAALAPRAGMSLGQAARTARFWQTGAAFFLVAGAIAAVIIHMVPMLIDRGAEPAAAARMMANLGLAIIVGRICVGLLVDRFHAPYVGLAFLLLPALACLLLIQGYALAPILLVGLAAGAEVDLLAYLTSRYYGLRAYGQIYGWQLAFFSLGAGIGPIVMGAAQDRAGSYDPALYACAAAMVVGALLLGTLGRFPQAEPAD